MTFRFFPCTRRDTGSTSEEHIRRALQSLVENKLCNSCKIRITYVICLWSERWAAEDRSRENLSPVLTCAKKKQRFSAVAHFSKRFIEVKFYLNSPKLSLGLQKQLLSVSRRNSPLLLYLFSLIQAFSLLWNWWFWCHCRAMLYQCSFLSFLIPSLTMM